MVITSRYFQERKMALTLYNEMMAVRRLLSFCMREQEDGRQLVADDDQFVEQAPNVIVAYRASRTEDEFPFSVELVTKIVEIINGGQVSEDGSLADLRERLDCELEELRAVL
jgi:hypothetical protein